MDDDIRPDPIDGADRSEAPNLNTGTPWNSSGDDDIRRQLDHKTSIREIADFFCRTSTEIRQRILEIAEADAIGDPSLLRDGLLRRDRVALETYRDARAAMALIREAIEDCAPPGSVVRESYLSPEFTVEAEALVRGICAMAGRYDHGLGAREPRPGADQRPTTRKQTVSRRR